MGWQTCPALSNRNGVGNSDRINKDLSHWEFKGSDMVDDGNNEDTGWCNLVKSDSNLRERMEEHSLSCKRKSSIKSKIVFQQSNNNCRLGLKYQMPLGDFRPLLQCKSKDTRWSPCTTLTEQHLGQTLPPRLAFSLRLTPALSSSRLF